MTQFASPACLDRLWACAGDGPTNFFQFWDNPATLPEGFAENHVFTRGAFPDWNHVLLNDDTGRLILTHDWPEIAAIYDKIRIPAVRSDIVRLAALHAFGGWYLDLDTRPTGALAPYVGDRDVIVFRDDRRQLKRRGDIMNGFLYMPRGSALARRTLEETVRNIRTGRDVHRVMAFAGPYLMAELIKREPDHDPVRLWTTKVYRRENAPFDGSTPLFDHTFDRTASSWRILQGFGILPGFGCDWGAFPDKIHSRFVRVIRDFVKEHGLYAEFLTLVSHRPAYLDRGGIPRLVEVCEANVAKQAAALGFKIAA